jgi:hypothetical protein
MRYQILRDYAVGSVLLPKDTILDFDNPQSSESFVGRDRAPPHFAQALDQEAWEWQRQQQRLVELAISASIASALASSISLHLVSGSL